VLVANAKGRYSRGASETLLDQDLATIRDGGHVDALIARLQAQVGRLDVRPEELVGRNQRSALFKTMFLAFRHDGAKDWRSNLTIALDHSGVQHKLQFHHIFPKAVLTKSGKTSREADDIANLAFISGKTNQKISDKAPGDYIKAMRESVGSGPFQSQCIPVEDELLELDSYESFLIRRRELIADRLNAFLGVEQNGATPVADPVLRALDERVEGVELRLRELIVLKLAADSSLLPSHIALKINDRVSAAVRKNPSLASSVETLEGKLRYSDLRELQDMISSKGLWPEFEATFGSKGVLETRCGQLAELRNTIRHSRPMNDVTRKDGEAALTWFAQVFSQEVVAPQREQPAG
jgi:hypothetical protein